MTPPESAKIAALQKIRKFHIETIAEAANEIAAIDREISILESNQ